jgi:RNase P subunit RPR2
LTVFRPATKIRANFEKNSLSIKEVIVAQGYCVKCKAKKEIANAQEVTMKNGRPAIQGVCPDCGTKIFCMQGGKK